MNPITIVRAAVHALVAGSRETRLAYREIRARQQAEMRAIREERRPPPPVREDVP